MKPRSLALLAVATVIAVCGASYVSMQRANEPAAIQVGLRLFPDLPTRADQVRRIEIVRGPGTVTLVREGDGWVAANRGNYPAMAQRANTRKWLEANPERASALNVRKELKGRHGITDAPEDLVNLIVANRKLKRAIREVSK